MLRKKNVQLYNDCLNILLGDIGQMVQTYIKSVSSRGGLITSTLANAAAKALMAKYPNMIANIDIDSSS